MITLFYSRTALKSKVNGYHKHGGKPVRVVYESDHSDSPDLFDSLHSEQAHSLGDKLSNMKPELLSFCRVLYRQRHDLHIKVARALTDTCALNSEEMKELRTAYRIYRQTGGVPRAGKAGVRTIPTAGGFGTIPADAEILRVRDGANEIGLEWTSPNLLQNPQITVTFSEVITTEVHDDEANLVSRTEKKTALKREPCDRAISLDWELLAA